MAIRLTNAAQSLTAVPAPPQPVGRYDSVDHMLTRYRDLCQRLGVPKAAWPDPKRVRDAGHPDPDHLQVEAADIALCLRRAHIAAAGRAVLRQLFRPRRRWCGRCQRVFPRVGERASCPRCRARRPEGWTWEAMPTADVLAKELSRSTRRKWTQWAVRWARDRAYEQIETAMREKHLLRGGG